MGSRDIGGSRRLSQHAGHASKRLNQVPVIESAAACSPAGAGAWRTCWGQAHWEKQDHPRAESHLLRGPPFCLRCLGGALGRPRGPGQLRARATVLRCVPAAGCGLAQKWHAAVSGLMRQQQRASLGQAVWGRPALHLQQPAAAAVMVICGQHNAVRPDWLPAGPVWPLTLCCCFWVAQPLLKMSIKPTSTSAQQIELAAAGSCQRRSLLANISEA